MLAWSVNADDHRVVVVATSLEPTEAAVDRVRDGAAAGVERWPSSPPPRARGFLAAAALWPVERMRRDSWP